jgi:hypothetical protein
VGAIRYPVSARRPGAWHRDAPRRRLSRWAAGVFTVGIGLAPASALLPHELQPLVAVPIGVGLPCWAMRCG